MPGKRIFLPGIDYFQLLIDHHSKKKGGRGHEARLAIFLEGKLEKADLLESLSKNKIWQQLSQISVSKTFGLGYPSIYFSKKEREIPITTEQLDGDEIPEENLNVQVDVYNKPPLHLQIIYFKSGNTCLLFTFHHILFDFAGVQSLFASLSGDENIPLLPAKAKQRPFTERLNLFFKAVFFTFREANNKMSVLQNALPKNNPFNTIYKEISFSKADTEKVFAACAEKGLQLHKSIYFLSATSKSLHENIFSKQTSHRFMWIPVPVNFRRKGSADAVLLNGLSFLFYKLTPDTLNDINAIQTHLRKQMTDQMRHNMPQAFVDFANGYKFMPMPFYYPMLQLPSLGKLSSFSFSVLGDTFKNRKMFLDLPILDIKNYPSNSTCPGVTFLFYEFRGELKIMSSWVKYQYNEATHQSVMESLREMLLGNKI